MSTQPSQNRTLLLVVIGLALLLCVCCVLVGVGSLSAGLFGIFDVVRGPGSRISERLPEQRVQVTAPLRLTIDNPVGDITLRPGSNDEVRVEATRYGPDRRVLDEISVGLTGSGDSATLTVTGPERRSNWGVDLVVRVPVQTSVRIEVGVGTIVMEDLDGRFEIRAGVGRIVARDLAIRDDSSFEGGTSDVQVSASLDPEVSVRANSGVGEVTVELPAGTGFELDASTGTGDVTIEGFELEAEREATRGVGDEVHDRTAADPEGRRLILNSGVGDITIRAR